MIELVAYGSPAREALVAAIAGAKAGDPLAPVTVIVPTNYAGLAMRRRLAGELGLVNVRFQVAARTAELLGGARLAAAGRKPLVPWVRREAIRAALGQGPGIFAPVAAHPATIRQIARAFDDLADAAPDTLTRLEGLGARPRDVVRLFRRVRELTRDFYDEADLVEAATEAVGAGDPACREAGVLILYLPRQVSRALARLMEAAGNGPGAHSIIGLTGEEETDALARVMAGRLKAGGAELREHAPAAVPTGDRVASLPDPEEEVRHAARAALTLARSGTPLHRIAILFEEPERYALLAHEVLESAGVPHNGPPIRRLGQSLAGRALLGGYRAIASGYRRGVVMDWLTSAPVAGPEGREAPAHQWDRISREAGVVRGAQQWAGRLEAWARRTEDRVTESDGSREYNARQAKAARELARFIELLAANSGAGGRKSPAGHAVQAREFLQTYLPRQTLERMVESGEAESKAWDDVEALLTAIAEFEGQLDPIFEAAISQAEFVTVLDEVLDAAWGRVGALGEGIFVGPAAAAAEMEFDAVFVIGMSEGNGGRGEDPIITEPEREHAGADIPSRRLRLTHRRRAYLAALAGGGRAVLSYPRADLRGQKELLPSRWLQESASALAGKALYASDIDRMVAEADRPGWFEAVDSFEAVLRAPVERVSLQERDLASLLTSGSRVDQHYLAHEIEGLAQGIEARRARTPRRASSAPRPMDAWNGRVGTGAAPLPGAERPISPTALETFADCPFRYLLKHVLHVGEAERPEDADTISAADIGNVMHAVLEEFLKAVRDRPDPVAEWSAGERTLLREIAEQHCSEAEAQGLTGHRVSWAAERARILRDLDLFLEQELNHRRGSGFIFDRAELAFGTSRDGSPPPPPASLVLGDGTVILFRGYIDRVDRNSEGRLLITDYKSGSSDKFKALLQQEAAGKLDGGKLLQLPVYALALEGEADGQPVAARYWFITEREGFATRRVAFDDALRDEFGHVVQTLVDTMRDGYFPAVADDSSRRRCEYCPYDNLCPSNAREDLWGQWQSDLGVIPLVQLRGKGGKDAEGGDGDA